MELDADRAIPLTRKPTDILKPYLYNKNGNWVKCECSVILSELPALQPKSHYNLLNNIELYFSLEEGGPEKKAVLKELERLKSLDNFSIRLFSQGSIFLRIILVQGKAILKIG